MVGDHEQQMFEQLIKRLQESKTAANFQPKATLSCRMIEVEPEAVKLKDWDNEQVLRTS